jgi:hypothetical protein
MILLDTSIGSGAGGFIGSSVAAIDVKGDIGTGLFSGTNGVKGNSVFGTDCSPLVPGQAFGATGGFGSIVVVQFTLSF